ncbi:MAG TPA: fructosamine kinase family protein [Myxococcota bacterium]|nr:fructosamine kinase family protein [Myxococcota bacterium]
MHGEDSLSPSLLARLSAALQGEVSFVRALGGGDINQAGLVSLDGQPVFVKWNPNPVPGMFACEAEGLGALRDTHTLRVPEPIAWGEDFLAMEYLPLPRARRDFGEELGRGLAALHRVTARRHGFHQDNVLAVLPQPNAWTDSWVAFWGHRRLAHFGRIALERGQLASDTFAALERLIARLGTLIPAHPPASRLHGDLWSGNVVPAPDGAPALVDPAVYHGHREVDLAMSELFGGFSASFYAAYRESWPLEPGYERRRIVYQIAPLLVHAILFGGPYEGQVASALSRLS